MSDEWGGNRKLSNKSEGSTLSVVGIIFLKDFNYNIWYMANKYHIQGGSAKGKAHGIGKVQMKKHVILAE